MKMVMAIVHKEDVQKVTTELNSTGFSVTKLSSTGGFLKSGNTTLLVGVEDDKVDEVIGIIDKQSRSRKQLITPSVDIDTMSPYSLEVEVGGATIFVLNVEKFNKV